MLFFEQPLCKIYTKILGHDMQVETMIRRVYKKKEGARVIKNNNIIEAGITYTCMCVHVCLEAGHME